MKASTHNLLLCNKKTCINNENNYPLIIKGIKIEKNILERDDEFSKIIFNKLNKIALNEWSKDLNIYKYDLTLPIEELEKNEDFINYLHEILFETQIIEGLLICKNCNQEYQIKNGIPNMLLKEE